MLLRIAKITFLLVCLSIYGFYMYLRYPGPLDQATLIYFQPGTTTEEMAQLLSQHGVFKHPDLVSVALHTRLNRAPLQAGEYEFTPHMTVLQVIALLQSGKTYTRTVTIPEGLTRHEIADILVKVPQLSGDITTLPDEGWMFPATYDFKYGDKRQAIIDRMHALMQKRVAEVWETRTPNAIVTTPTQLITLASLVEREAKKADERAPIAAVFYNRLQKNMPLQCDPTVIYAVAAGKTYQIGRALTRADLQCDSPYNTYRYKGLPPGPIANPGLAALKAAAHPAATASLYFVVDGITGGHVFAETLAQHNKNVQAWRARIKTAT